MKKGLKIMLVILVVGILILGGAIYSIIYGKTNISSSDILSTAFAEDVLMCNRNDNGIHFKLMGPGIIEEVLKRLGLNEDELKSAWENGQTLLEFAAESKGITKDNLAAVVKEVVTNKVEQLVKDGKITEDQKTKFLENLEDFVERFIIGPRKRGPHGGRRGMGGFDYCPNIDNSPPSSNL